MNVYRDDSRCSIFRRILVLGAIGGLVGACAPGGTTSGTDNGTSGGETKDTGHEHDTGVSDADMSRDDTDGPRGTDAESDSNGSEDAGTRLDGSNGGDGRSKTCANIDCGSEQICKNGRCMASPRAKCSGSSSTIRPGKTVTLEGAFEASDGDVMETTCATDDPAPDPERVYKISADEDTKILAEASIPGDEYFGITMEVRRGACLESELDESGDAISCIDEGVGMFEVSKGTTFYLIVERDTTRRTGDFEVTLDGYETSKGCAFGSPGDAICRSGHRIQCQNDTSGNPFENLYPCPRGCSNGLCKGSTCSNPFRLSANSDESQTYRGYQRSFPSNYNFDESDSSCHIMNTPPSTRGSEVIFELEGLQKGQTIEVDTTADRHNVIMFLTQSCKSPSNLARMTCVESNAESVGDAKMSATTSSAGDHYVFIDSPMPNPKPFVYTIDIE